MKGHAGLKFVAMMFAMSMLAAGPALAQSASESMHEAGTSAKSAASSAGSAVVHAYHGTKTAAEDTAITAKIKTALHDDKLTTGRDIHVTTVAGVVTMRGAVASSEISDRAEHIARSTNGVTRVRNKLKVLAASKVQ